MRLFKKKSRMVKTWYAKDINAYYLHPEHVDPYRTTGYMEFYSEKMYSSKYPLYKMYILK